MLLRLKYHFNYYLTFSNIKIMKILITFFLVACISLHVNNRKLLLAQILFRHGARYPIYSNPYDGTDKPQINNNLGELTLQGKNMHYLLGKTFYSKYWMQLFGGTQNQFKYNHSQILVKSTDVNRTIQSAQSNLMGWLQNLNQLTLNQSQRQFSLPAFDNFQQYVDLNYTNGQNWKIFNQVPLYQTIPIHTGRPQDYQGANPFDQGDFLVKSDWQNCPNQLFWAQQNFNSDLGKYMMNIPIVTQALKKINQLFPSMNLNFSSVYRVIDNYVCLKYLGMSYLSVFQDPKYQNALKYIKQASLYLSTYHQNVQKRVISTRFFQNTLNNIDKAINLTGPKLVIYSAHDTTVAMVLAAMNFTNVQCINEKYIQNVSNDETCASNYPPFTSNIIFQIYEQDNGVHSFQVIFNGKTMKIPICDWQTICKLDKLKQWYQNFKIQNPNQVCGIKDVDVQTQVSKQMKLYAVIGVLGLTLMILAIFYWKLHSDYKELKNPQKKDGYMQNFQEKEMK